MTQFSPHKVFCLLLVLLIGVPPGLAQTALPRPPAPEPQAGGALLIGVLQGDKAVNSIPLLQSTAIVVEVRDTNDLPMEGATVVFTLPGPGAGGTFIGGATSFTTRTDFHGQASALEIVPKVAGQFRIKVAATLGTRKGETAVTQTNTNRTLSAHRERGAPAWYMRKRTWIIAGAAAAAGVTAVLLTGQPKTVTVTPGVPVFQ